MPKGYFSQCFCLLTDGSTSIAALRTSIEQAGLAIVKEIEAAEHWEFSGPAIIVPYRPEVNGTVSIDVVNHPWPDTMGDPKSALMTFGAWSFGHFGPFAYPGGLGRAIQHARAWQSGRTIVPNHQGIIRLRVSYVGGLPENAKVLPRDYDPLAELIFLNRLILAAATAPGVLCYFNPNGEVLRDTGSFRSFCDACAQEQKLPIQLWSNARLFNLDATFGFMDTVGNSQLDVRDIEVIYPVRKYDPGIIDYYMRNVTHYLIGLDRELRTGETIDGPGERNLSWVIESRDEGLTTPPRKVLRLYPAADAIAIRRLADVSTSR